MPSPRRPTRLVFALACAAAAACRPREAPAPRANAVRARDGEAHPAADAAGDAGGPVRAAQDLLRAGRFREARAAAEALASSQPGAEVFGVSSDAALALGDYPAAVDAAQRAVDARADGETLARAAWLRWAYGDAEGARAVMERALAAAQGSPRARATVATQAARLAWNAGDARAALALADEALRAEGGYGPAHAARARALLASGGSADEAVREAEAAMRASPSAANAWLAGDACSAAGRADEARAHYAAVERADDADDSVVVSLFLSTRGRDPARALRLAERAHQTRGELTTDDALAWALYRAGRLDEAAAQSARARRTGIRDARILYHAGRIAQAQGRRAEAVAALRDALAANPHWDRDEAAEARAALISLGAADAARTP